LTHIIELHPSNPACEHALLISSAATVSDQENSGHLLDRFGDGEGENNSADDHSVNRETPH
jgi:hypothetical protein